MKCCHVDSDGHMPSFLPDEKGKVGLERVMEGTPEGGVGIVYCRKRTDCDELAGALAKTGLVTAAYHAGLNAGTREAVGSDKVESG